MRRSKKKRNQDFNDEALTLIRDINAMILGALEDDKTPLRSIQRDLVKYMQECEEYFSKRSRGNKLPAAIRRFGSILERLIQFRTQDIRKINEEQE